MLVEIDPVSGALRLDDDGLAALDSPSPAPEHPDLRAALGSMAVRAVLAARQAPVVTLDLVVAGPDTRLTHRAWVDEQWAGLQLQVRPGVHQLMAVPPGHLAAGLVRLVRLRPRRVDERTDVPFPRSRLDDLVATEQPLRAAALADAGAELAWRLEVGSADGGQVLTATDGAGGLHLAEAGQDVLRAVSNTTGYRLLSTVLPVGEAAVS